MNKLCIAKQTEAENDEYLIDCFHDSGFIKELIDSNHSIVSGRMGSGKTAIAKYLEKKGESFGVDFTYRISIRNVDFGSIEDTASHNIILFFILIKTIQKLLKAKFFGEAGQVYWSDFLSQNGFENILDYSGFSEMKKTIESGVIISGGMSVGIAKADSKLDGRETTESTRIVKSKAPSSLIEKLCESIQSDKVIYIFIDDISDSLDNSSDESLKKDISTIYSVLYGLSEFNGLFKDEQKSIRFISLVREDLFDFMEGSNVNKLLNNSLELKWDEKSFAGLLIRRLPIYRDDLEENLSNPISALRRQFPDCIFTSALDEFEIEKYDTKFYAYMTAVSFNRPRDFLKFCYALRDRLSLRHPVEFKNIDSAEGEYSVYFKKEIKDELLLVSKALRCNLTEDVINRLVDTLSQRKEGYSSLHLQAELTQYFGKKKIENFISKLVRYGILGFRIKGAPLINFSYMARPKPFLLNKIKEYLLFLHRGLWYFSSERKKISSVRAIEQDLETEIESNEY